MQISSGMCDRCLGKIPLCHEQLGVRREPVMSAVVAVDRSRQAQTHITVLQCTVETHMASHTVICLHSITHILSFIPPPIKCKLENRI